MEKWRRKGDKCNQEPARMKSNHHYRKPPLGGNPNPNPHQNIPYWEKRFVSTIGTLSWKKFLEAKEFIHLYDNIMKWDDCAGKEAFYNAKDRFYAQFHNLPCDDESHNPDLYIDQIDWNGQLDHSLIQDLDSEPVGQDDASPHEPVVIFGDVLPDPYKDFSPYGWGDTDEKIQKSWGINDEIKKDQSGINWDDYIENGRIIWDKCDVNGNDWWASNENGNIEENQVWNANTYNDDYYGYSNMDKKRCVTSQKTWRFHGNGSRRNNGNWRKSTGQTYDSQHGQGSTFRAYGNQRIHVHQ